MAENEIALWGIDMSLWKGKGVLSFKDKTTGKIIHAVDDKNVPHRSVRYLVLPFQ